MLWIVAHLCYSLVKGCFLHVERGSCVLHGGEHTSFVRVCLDGWIDMQHLHPREKGTSATLRPAASLPETQEPISQADSTGRAAASREKKKTWLLPSRNLLSSWKNKKIYIPKSDSRTCQGTLEGTESECQRRQSLAASGVAGRWVTACGFQLGGLQDSLRATNSKLLTRLSDLV